MTSPARTLNVLRKLRLPILVLLFLVSALTAALGDWRSQPFDSIISTYPGINGTPTYNWSDTCTQQVLNGPTLVYGNNPETWQNTRWTDSLNVFHDHVVLAQGSIGAPYGLVAFHYQNGLSYSAGANATEAYLVIGVDSSATNVGIPIIGESSGSDPSDIGAQATTAFLQQYVTGVGGRPMSVVSGFPTSPRVAAPQISIAPRLLYFARVQNGMTVSGELAIPISSGSANIYVLACTTSCYAVYDFPANSDGTHARGQFTGAKFDVQYNYTPAYVTGGGFAFEILNGAACTPDLVGVDLLAPSPSPSPVLQGDYSVPIVIHGIGTSQASQRFGLNPRGGFPFRGAAWVQQVIDPGQPAYTAVQPAAYILPTPSPIPTSGYSVSLGYDNYGTGHAFTYILPGGNFAPEWIWDYVATPLPLFQPKYSH